MKIDQSLPWPVYRIYTYVHTYILMSTVSKLNASTHNHSHPRSVPVDIIMSACLLMRYSGAIPCVRIEDRYPKKKIEDSLLVSTFALVSSSTVTNVRTSCRGGSQQEFVKMTRRGGYVTSTWVIQGRACHQQSMHWMPNNMQGETQQPRGMKRFSGDKNCRTVWQGTNEQLGRHATPAWRASSTARSRKNG
jgi:hypothetical protein